MHFICSPLFPSIINSGICGDKFITILRDPKSTSRLSSLSLHHYLTAHFILSSNNFYLHNIILMNFIATQVVMKVIISKQ